MNTTVLALQEEQVLVAVGKSGAQPSVQALYSAPAHGGRHGKLGEGDRRTLAAAQAADPRHHARPAG